MSYNEEIKTYYEKDWFIAASMTTGLAYQENLTWRKFTSEEKILATEFLKTGAKTGINEDMIQFGYVCYDTKYHNTYLSVPHTGWGYLHKVDFLKF